MKKSIWIVGALAVILGAIYFFTRDSQVSVGIKQLKLPVFVEDKADRIEILTKEPVELVRKDNSWKLKLGDKDNPRLVDADQTNISSLLQAALAVRSSHYVTNLKEKKEELGFGKDMTTTVVIHEGGKTLWTLELGKNAQAAGRYARLPGEDEIYVVRGSFWQLTRNGPIDFRDRDIWSVKEGEIDRLSIVKPDGSELMLAKGEGENQWQFDKAQQGVPKDFRADNSLLAGLARAAMSLRASGFVDEAQTLASPILVIKASAKEANPSVEIFPHSDDKYLARRVGDDQIFEITKHSFERLNQPIEAMRDLSVIRFDKAKVSEFILRSGKERVVVKKEEGQWRVVEPAKLPDNFEFDAASVDDVLSLLVGLKGERLASAKDVAEKADWQKEWMVELHADTDKIHLFASKSKTNKDEYLIRGNIDENIYVVKAMRLNSLSAGVSAFKKEEFDLPPIDENTKGFESLPVDVQRKLLNITKEKKKP